MTGARADPERSRRTGRQEHGCGDAIATARTQDAGKGRVWQGGGADGAATISAKPQVGERSGAPVITWDKGFTKSTFTRTALVARSVVCQGRWRLRRRSASPQPCTSLRSGQFVLGTQRKVAGVVAFVQLFVQRPEAAVDDATALHGGAGLDFSGPGEHMSIAGGLQKL